MDSLRALFCIGLLLLSASAPGSWLRAQDAGSKAGQLWKDARGEFGTGDYAKAAESLEAIIKASRASIVSTDNTVAPPTKWLEPVYFMLGAAYFDAKDWPNAIRVFNEYKQFFPLSPHMTEVNFALGQANLLGGHPEDAIPLFTSLLPFPDYHVKVFMLLVEANFSAGKPDAAIALMEAEEAASVEEICSRIARRGSYLFEDPHYATETVISTLDCMVEEGEAVGIADGYRRCWKRVRRNDLT